MSEAVESCHPVGSEATETVEMSGALELMTKCDSCPACEPSVERSVERWVTYDTRLGVW